MAVVCHSGIERDTVVNDLLSRIDKLERKQGMITRTTPSTSSGGDATFSIPVGGIIMWAGAIANIPEGWALCDGTDETPDLRNSFIVAAGDTYAVGDTGGEDASDLSHTHDPGTLAADAAGGHTHSSAGGHNHGGVTSKPSQTTYGGAGENDPASAHHTHTIDSAGGHTHNTISNHAHTVSGATATAGSAAQENRPVFYALAFIMKVAG